MANFDKDKPAGNQKVRLSDDDIRTNNAALEDAIGRDHKFPTGDGVDSGEHLQITFNAVLGSDPDPGSGKFALYPKNNGASKPDLFCQDEDDTVLKVFLGEAGTEMVFIQNSAPTGWTRNTARQDNAMLCHAASGNIGSGGSVNPQSTHTHSGPSHTHSFNGGSHTHSGPSHAHSTSGHTLTISEMPAHTHSVTGYSNSASGNYFRHSSGTSSGASLTVGSKGGGGSHTHGNTGSGGTGATGGATVSGTTGSGGTGATGANTAPYYLETISCTRDA